MQCRQPHAEPLRRTAPNRWNALLRPLSILLHPIAWIRTTATSFVLPPRPYYTPPLASGSPTASEATKVPQIVLSPAIFVSSTATAPSIPHRSASPGKLYHPVLTERIKDHRTFVEKQVAAHGRIAAHLAYINHKEAAEKRLEKQRKVLPIDFPVQCTIDSTVARRNFRGTRGSVKEIF